MVGPQAQFTRLKIELARARISECLWGKQKNQEPKNSQPNLVWFVTVGANVGRGQGGGRRTEAVPFPAGKAGKRTWRTCILVTKR